MIFLLSIAERTEVSGTVAGLATYYSVIDSLNTILNL